MEMRTLTIRTILLFLFCSQSIIDSFAQQDQMYSMYMYNQLLINPAYAGSLPQNQAVGLFRRQWVNFPGSPSTATVSVQGRIGEKNMGWGFNAFNDNLGIIHNTGANGVYSYSINLKKSKLAFGLQAGVRNFTASLTDSKLSSNNEFDQAFDNNISHWSFNFGTGIFYYSENWFVSLGVPHLRTHRLSDKDLNTPDEARLNNHYFLNGAYILEINDQIKVKPSMLVKAVSGAPMQADLNVNAYYHDSYGIGLSYRTGETFLIMSEIKISNNFQTAIAYDIAIGKVRRSLGGSFEIMLKYDFRSSKDSETEFERRLF